MGVSEGSRTSERTSGDDGAHPGRRRAASHNRPRTAAPKKPLLVDVIATSSDFQQDPPALWAGYASKTIMFRKTQKSAEFSENL